MTDTHTRKTTSGIPRKARILDMLEAANGWQSGESISAVLGISRAAVAKHIHVLQRDGHIIEAAPRKGYRLLLRDTPITVETIQQHLTGTLVGQKHWRFLDKTSSTNNEAVAWAMEGAPEGSVVYAEQQTHGKGQKGHHWFSAPRGLQFSVIVRPISGRLNTKTDLTPQELLTRIAMLAVAQSVVETSGLSPRLKTPNDVLINKHKVSGILVETGFRGAEPDWSVIGIGCNVNARAEDFPAPLKSKAGSLLRTGGKAIPRALLLASILNHLDYWYAAVSNTRNKSKNLDRMLAAWATYTR